MCKRKENKNLVTITSNKTKEDKEENKEKNNVQNRIKQNEI